MAEAPVPLLGRIALHLKLLTPEQLADATRHQAERGGKEPIGQVLVAKGYLTEAQLKTVLRARDQLVAKQKAAQAVAGADPEPEVGPAKAAAAPAKAAPPPPAPRSAPKPVAHAVAPASAPQPAAGAGASLNDLLREGVERGASDVHIHAGSARKLRLHGQFTSLGADPIEAATAERLILSALSPEQAAALKEKGELDFAYEVPELGRFRVNVYRQQRGLDGVFRCIPARVPSLEQLGLPAGLARFTNFHQGLVLVTGPANCGKSATLAALVDIVNEERAEHILTVEDPVEYVHPSRSCVVNQRDVGRHTDSFARALRAALREDPDVIVIGELRDLETISLALTAAETGHLVLGTLHTSSAIRTLNRLVGVFPADQQEQIRNMVSESLRAVISQRLVPRKDGKGRVPALEVLVNNKAIGNLIRENKTFQIFSILQTGSGQGMCLLDDSLNKLVASGTISRDEALKHADDLKRIKG